MEWDLSDHHLVLGKVKLVGAWIKRGEVVVGARRIRSKKLIGDQYREGCTRSLEGMERIMSSICGAGEMSNG